MRRIYFFMVAMIYLLASCSKGEPVEQMRNTSLLIRTFTVDPLLLKVEVNDSVMISAQTTPIMQAFSAIKYTEPAHRFRITNLYTNGLMLDTVINYNTSFQQIVNFVQTGANNNMVWVGRPVNEPAPPAGKIKISVVYVTSTLPDSIKVVVENSVSGTSDNDFAVSDSFVLQKGQFSPYFHGWSDNRKRPRLKIYTTDTARTLISTVSNSLFYQVTTGISIYAVDMTASGFVTTTKLY